MLALVMLSGQRYTLKMGETLIGRGADCLVRINNPLVSRHHAVIRWDGRQAVLIDMASDNGTYLNQQRLASKHAYPIKSGDQIQIGGADVRLQVQLVNTQPASNRGQKIARSLVHTWKFGSPSGERENRFLRLLIRGGTVAGAIAGILGLLFQLFPVLRPADPVKELSADLRIVTIEYNVTRASYLKRFGLPLPSSAAGNQMGVVVNFEAATTGYKSCQCFLRWSIYENLNKRRSDKYSPPIMDERWKIYVEPKADRDTKNDYFWAPTPDEPGEFYLRLEFFNDRDERLKLTDSALIRVR